MSKLGFKIDMRFLTILVIGLFLIAAGIGIFIAVDDANARIVTLTISHPFESKIWATALRAELKEFEGLNRKIKLSVIDGDFSSVQQLVKSSPTGWDIVIGSSALARDATLFTEAPEALTGSLWGIYYNKEILSKLKLPPGAKTGDYSIEDFKKLCLEIRAGGKTPISLGSQYGWPLAAWIQALMASESGPQAALDLVQTNYNSSDPRLDKAIQLFSSFEKEGLVNPDHESKDWPLSIRDILAGKAAFCLLDENFISSLLPAEREKIGYLPLPGSGSQGKTSWAIGSLVYLGVNKASVNPKASARLQGFLTSPGVTERLTRQLEVPFFAKGTGPQTVVASIASFSTSPLFKEIKTRLKN